MDNQPVGPEPTPQPQLQDVPVQQAPETFTQPQPIQQPTAQNNVPDTPPAQAWQQPTSPQTGTNPGKTMGIVALVLSVIGFYLIGFILGLVAMSKSKKAGFGMNILGLIAVIWSVIGTIILVPLTVIVLTNYSSTASTADDISMIANQNALYAKLEEYYMENNAYPEELSASLFPGIDESVLSTPDDKLIEVISVTNSTEADNYEMPTKSAPYQYLPYGCSSTGCKGYVLRAYISAPTTLRPNPYVKYGLMNP